MIMNKRKLIKTDRFLIKLAKYTSPGFYIELFIILICYLFWWLVESCHRRYTKIKWFCRIKSI
jgi:hypothetical protein